VATCAVVVAAPAQQLVTQGDEDAAVAHETPARQQQAGSLPPAAPRSGYLLAL
jgi:hypothetical protein